MFNPDKTDYPQNAKGEPEFASIILTIDSVSLQAEGDDVTQKIVLSTQDMITALSKITNYFGEPSLLANPSNAHLLVEAGRVPAPLFVYLTPREGTTQIITSTITWDQLVQHPSVGNGSALMASERIQMIAAKQLTDFIEFAGGVPKLILLSISPEQFESGEQPAKEDPEAEQAPVGKNTAESLVDTAEFIQE